MRRIVAVLVILVLAAGMLGSCGFASAEEAEGIDLTPATQTDLCTHEHVRQVIFFDYPNYRAINRYVHNVFGSAVVNTVCDDCGEVLASERVDRAEELREHTYSKKGVCRLCGYVRPDESSAAAGNTAGAAGEMVIRPEVENDTWTVSVTKADVGSFPEGTEVLVVRPEGSATALAVRLSPAVTDALALGTLIMRMTYEEENAVHVTLRITESYGNGLIEVPAEDFTLRLYDPCTELTAAFEADAPDEDGAAPGTPECTWTESGADDGFWSVSWMGDGLYTFKK